MENDETTLDRGRIRKQTRAKLVVLELLGWCVSYLNHRNNNSIGPNWLERQEAAGNGDWKSGDRGSHTSHIRRLLLS